MTWTAETPLAEIVSDRVEVAPVLADIGLDFCCGGGRTLGAACDELDLDVVGVLGRLEQVDAGPDPAWVGLAGPDLADHLEATHHEFLRARLPYLDDLAAKVESVHGDRHPELHQVGALFRALRADLEPHLMKEERVLFPMIRELYEADGPVAFHCGTLQNPISVMASEHDRAGELLAALRATTDGYEPPDDACASYTALYAGLAELEADTHLHVHKENNLLFPAVVAEERRRAASRS